MNVSANFVIIAAQTSSSLLALTTLSLLVPAAFNLTADNNEDAEIGILNLSHGTALVLLVVYGLSLLFQVKLRFPNMEAPYSHVALCLCILAQDPSCLGKFHGKKYVSDYQ